MDTSHLVPEGIDPFAFPLQNLSQQQTHRKQPSEYHSHQPPQHGHGEYHQQDETRSFISFASRRRPSHALAGEMDYAVERRPQPRKLVLCFDGTGNRFRGDDSDSNILKIFRMLDRTAEDQYHYYQPGIGTYVVSGGLGTHTSIGRRIKSWYIKAKDSAFGSSFDEHVVGGYRFLMRFYNPGDEIYIFGFSRGAYIARFLAEMLDYVGLLSHGNEEMVQFAWKSFSQWQCRRQDDSEAGNAKKKEMYAFMKGFRETFSRPVRRIQFIGLFDTVNSVPRFETAWMQRSKFPYTARSSAKVIRHAVAIDERRAKFRQDLVYQSAPSSTSKHRDAREVLHDVHEKYRARRHALQAKMTSAIAHAVDGHADDEKNRGRRPSKLSVLSERDGDRTSDEAADPAPYRAHSRSVSRDSRPIADDASGFSRVPLSDKLDDDDVEQSLLEVWFAGDHADIGGGWEIIPGIKSSSHVPLTWMVREAMRAGLAFDPEKVAAMGCSEALDSNWVPNVNEARPPETPATAGNSAAVAGHNSEIADSPQPLVMPPNIRINSQEETITAPSTLTSSSVGIKDAADDIAAAKSGHTNIRLSSPRTQFHEMIYKAHLAPIHDTLEYNKGLDAATVTSWKLMEYLPFRRMDLQPDGSWKPIRWPLPCGETRDVPDNVYVHGSVLRRMHNDPSYRPGNLIVGGGGRGCRVAPSHYGMGEWECVAEKGDLIGELWVKKKREEA